MAFDSMWKFVATLLLLIVAHSKSEQLQTWPDEEETPEFWLNLGKEELMKALELQQLNMNVARNVIILLGDGMGIPSITAGRILKGQLQGRSGEETKLAMDKFDHVGLSKTYSVDKQVSDSAATANAFLTGVKTKYYTLGLSGKVRIKNCSSAIGNEVDSILVDAYRKGKSTGVVTTTRINHATPAASYAHSASRTWYGDADLPQEARDNGCKDLAQQFYDESDKITLNKFTRFQVALGGGRGYFQPNSTFDPEYSTSRNRRTDGQDLIEQWLESNRLNGLDAKYVWNKTEFDKVDPYTTDKLLGLFQPSDMQYEVDREEDTAGEPSLADMVKKAIQMLQRNSKGFFLLVEGGRIDHAQHSTNAHAALHDVVAFDDAIEQAVQMTSDSDTLIIVTADHSHTLNMGGYSDRGNPIFGLAVSEGEVLFGLDNKPFTTLLFGNGRSYQGPDTAGVEPHTRQNLTNLNTETRDYEQQTAVPLSSETHGGEDVAIMARGPMSHLIHGVHEQSYIAYVMRYASCLGSDTAHCDGGSILPPSSHTIKNSTTASFSPTTKSSTTTSSIQHVSSNLVTFLGLGLDATDVEVALNVQFALLIVFFVLFLAMTLLAMSKRKVKSTNSERNSFEKYSL